MEAYLILRYLMVHLDIDVEDLKPAHSPVNIISSHHYSRRITIGIILILTGICYTIE